MKKTIIALLIAVLAVFVACDQEEGLVQDSTKDVLYSTVKFDPVVSQTKAISTSSSQLPTTFEYTARPMFDKTDQSVSYGDTGETAVELTQDTATGYYTPTSKFVRGQWEFTIIGKVGETAVYKGTKTIYLNSETVVVPVSVYPDLNSSVTGCTVSVSVTAPKLTGGAVGSFTANVYDFSQGNTFTGGQAVSLTPSVSGAVVTGTGELSLAEGLYMITISYTEGTGLSACTVGASNTVFIVKNGLPTTITGRIENGAFSTANLNFSYLNGSISRDGNTYSYSPADGSLTPTDYVWFINGEQRTTGVNGGELSWSETVSGLYYVTCVAICRVDNAVVDVFSASLSVSI